MFKASSGAVYRRPKALAGGPRQVLSNLLRDGNTVADYQPGNYTGTLNASAWANSIGAAGSLLQATGANQPIILSSDYVKKAYLSGVNGNYFGTPNTVGHNITADLDLAVYSAADDWTPSVFSAFFSQKGFEFYLDNTSSGKLTVTWYNGADAAQTTVATAATGISDAVDSWIRVTIDSNNGAGGADVAFYKSSDPVESNSPTWTQIGTTVTVATTGWTNHNVTEMRIGAFENATSTGAKRIKRMRLKNGIDGTLVAEFNANDWSETSTNGATQASSTTGEVWMLNNTGAKLAQIVATPQLLFDGAAHYMTVTTTLGGPLTAYVVVKQITWTGNDYILDGLTANTFDFRQETATPTIGLAGSTAVSNALALNTYGVVAVVGNAAASSISINGTAQVTGTYANSNMNGLTLASLGNGIGGFKGNLQAKEIIIRNVADSTATQAQIQSLLKQLYGTP